MPFPRAETTPPVTKMKRVSGRLCGMQVSGEFERDWIEPGGRLPPAGGVLTPRPAAPSACLRAPAPSDASAPSIRISSSTTPSPASSSTVRERDVRRPPTSRSGSGRSASAAICGRCVMQSTWRARRAPAAARPPRAPSGRPRRRPPRRTRASADSPAPATVISASITRDSSPPDAALAHRRRRHARVGREHQLDALGAGRADAPRAARAAPRTRRPPSPAPPAPSRTRSASRGAASRRALRQLGRASASRSARASASSASARSVATSASSSRVALGPAALGVRQHRRDAAAVLALEPVVLLEPLLDLLEPPGLGLERLRVAAQLAAHVVRLDAQRREPLGEPVQLAGRRPRPLRPAARPRPAAAPRRPRRPTARSPRPPPPARPAARPSAAAARARRPAPRARPRVGLERLDLLDLEARAGPGRGRACRRARAARPARASSSRTRACAAASASRSVQLLAPAEAVQQVELGRGERRAGGARAGRRRRPAARRARCRSAAVAERPCDERPRAALGADAPREHDLVGAPRRCARAARPAPGSSSSPAGSAKTPST